MTKKATTKEPFLPLFVGDFSAATAEWEGEAQSLYLTLLMHQWAIGSIPSEPKRICKLVKWDWPLFETHWATVRRKFQSIEVVSGGEKVERLVNVRLEQHRSKTRQLSAKNSESGSKGAAGKWGDDRPDHSMTRAQRLAEARKRGTHTATEWSLLVLICGPDCRRCQSPGATFVKDHITPIYQGGSDAIENIQPLCKPCNSAKGPDRTDFRPDDWRERLALALKTSGDPAATSGERQAQSANARLADSSETPGIHPIPSDPIRSHGQSDTSSQDSSSAGSTTVASAAMEEMRQAGAMARALRELGVDVTSMHPTLMAWVQEGYTIEQLTEVTAIARKRKGEGVLIAANYIDTILRNPPKSARQQRQDENVSASVAWLQQQEAKDATG